MDGWRKAAAWLTLSIICLFSLPLSAAGAEGGEILSGQSTLAGDGSSADFSVFVPEAGEYALEIAYRIPEASLQELRVDVAVNGRSAQRQLALPALWQDGVEEYLVNEYGNDLYPMPEHVPAWQTAVLRDRRYYSAEPLSFTLAAGENTVTLTAHEVAVDIRGVTAVSVSRPAAYAGAEAGDSDYLQIIEAERYSWKNRSSIRGNRSRDVQLHPYDAAHARINALSGASWQTPGDTVAYTFDVPADGVYFIGLRLGQTYKKDLAVCKTILMDGVCPYEELAAYPFAYAGGVRQEVLTAAGEPVGFRLTAGTHTLSLASTAAPYAEVIEAIDRLAEEMNSLALDIRVISGNKSDADREWHLEKLMPDAPDRLRAQIALIDRVFELLEGGEMGTGESTLSTLKATRQQITRYLEDENGLNDLVNGLGQFAQASGSLAESIAMLSSQLLRQPLDVDRVYILGRPELMPEDSAGFLARVGSEAEKIVASYTVESDVANRIDKDALNVWMIASVTQVDTLREMVYQAFPAQAINLSVLSDESKLQLAISAGDAPDVVLGGSRGRPYQLGIRGAVYDLRAFEDFDEVAARFTDGMFVPYRHNDKVYALPQTMNLWALFYRTDILDALGLDVPEDWDQLIRMLPTLYRYGMNVGTVAASSSSLKGLVAVMPILMQHGARIYSDDGLSVDFTEPTFMRGFTYLTDLYTKYDMDASIGSFYNGLRNGSIPLGIADLSTYILLKNAAGELDGLWDLAPIPGIRQADGSVSRLHPTMASPCYILAGTKRPEAAWDFLKWWMSSETQKDFAFRLQTTWGETYLWMSANVQAIEESTMFTAKDKQVILGQLAQTAEITPHPANTFVERALSNAWTSVVVGGEDVRTALDSAQLEAMRGITQKMQEFGCVDDAGQVIRPFFETEAP